jgi:hypothetical protein
MVLQSGWTAGNWPPGRWRRGHLGIGRCRHVLGDEGRVEHTPAQNSSMVSATMISVGPAGPGGANGIGTSHRVRVAPQTSSTVRVARRRWVSGVTVSEPMIPAADWLAEERRHSWS